MFEGQEPSPSPISKMLEKFNNEQALLSELESQLKNNPATENDSVPEKERHTHTDDRVIAITGKGLTSEFSIHPDGSLTSELNRVEDIPVLESQYQALHNERERIFRAIYFEAEESE